MKAKEHGSSSKKDKGKTPHLGCYICNGPHYFKDCPKREKLNALIAEESESDSEGPERVAHLQILNVLQAEETTMYRPRLMFVQTKVNGHRVLSMIDNGATHNFIAKKMVNPLGLKVSKHSSRIKAVNFQAQVVKGMAFDVKFSIGEWKGRLDLMVVPLDDFEVILGNNFFIGPKVSIIPHMGGSSSVMRRNLASWLGKEGIRSDPLEPRRVGSMGQGA